MNVLSIRRVTNDSRHNAFTGCCWFKGNLYVAYRQGDAHVCNFGRVVVLRSRDRGVSWDHVAVIRGPGDTRDAHLYTDGECLFVVAFVYEAGQRTTEHYTGHAWTRDGDVWAPWQRLEGTGKAVLWRPRCFRGTHYCAGYSWDKDPGSHRKVRREVHWFVSKDGHRWRRGRLIHHGADEPNECYLDIRPDGRATMLMRCEGRGRHPYLCTSRYPFRSWTKRRLMDISIGGPCLWTVGDDVYLSARWRNTHGGRHFAHTAIFKVVKGRCELECVMPSGPSFDHSYMAVSRNPNNAHRFSMSFYSDAIAPNDPSVNQWTHPDIYLADVLFEAEYLRDGFRVSALQANQTLGAANCPDPGNASLKFRTMKAGDPADPDFLNVVAVTKHQPGIVYIVRDIHLVSADKIRLHLGYDGPVKVWWNGREVFCGTGKNPAVKDMTPLVVTPHDGANRFALALDTNGGKAEGVFVRWERL